MGYADYPYSTLLPRWPACRIYSTILAYRLCPSQSFLPSTGVYSSPFFGHSSTIYSHSRASLPFHRDIITFETFTCCASVSCLSNFGSSKDVVTESIIEHAATKISVQWAGYDHLSKWGSEYEIGRSKSFSCFFSLLSDAFQTLLRYLHLSDSQKQTLANIYSKSENVVLVFDDSNQDEARDKLAELGLDRVAREDLGSRWSCAWSTSWLIENAWFRDRSSAAGQGIGKLPDFA
jgi:hypothetical protein